VESREPWRWAARPCTGAVPATGSPKKILRLKSMYGLYQHRLADRVDRLEKVLLRGGSGGSAFRASTSPFPEGPALAAVSHAFHAAHLQLKQLKAWGENAGIPLSEGVPQAKNTVKYDGRSHVHPLAGTCDIFPTGARYSPDFTFKRLLAEKKIVLHDHTLIPQAGARRRQAECGGGSRRSSRGTGAEVEYRARIFAVASGYTWSSHLLLLLVESSRFPNGLANRTGQVGKYMNGHAFTSAIMDVDTEVYPGMNPQYGLISRQFFRCAKSKPYARHDTSYLGTSQRAAAIERFGRTYFASAMTL